MAVPRVKSLRQHASLLLGWHRLLDTTLIPFVGIRPGLNLQFLTTMAAHRAEKLSGAVGVLVAVAGVYLIVTSSAYDPSRLQIGTCTSPTAEHLLVYGSLGLSESAERNRASNADESPDLTKHWKLTILTVFTPNKAYTTGVSLIGKKVRQLAYTTTISAGMFEGFDASMEKQSASAVSENPVGPGGECFVFENTEEAWYSTEALAITNTQSASSRFNQGVASIAVGLAVVAAAGAVFVNSNECPKDKAL